MMDYSALKSKILNGPLAAECAGKDDEGIAAIYNRKDIPAIALVDIGDVQVYLMRENVWWDIVDAAKDPNHAAYYVARRCIDYFNAPRIEHLDFSLPFVIQMTEGLVTSALVSQAQLDTVRAMTHALKSQAEIDGFGTVTAGDVSRALRGPW